MIEPSLYLGLHRGGTFNRPRDWAAFERLTRDLFIRLLDNDHVDLNGRTGQPQAGVDVHGVERSTRKLVGIQCKGRADAHFARGAGLTADEVRAEVERAREFTPPLDRFLILTTGPNDVGLKKLARELSAAHVAEGLFEIEFHGWDWIEGHLSDHVDLAAGYGLIAVAHPEIAPVSRRSRIAAEIGDRLDQAIAMMNADREGDDVFTLPGLARHVGHKDWRRLEQIVRGTADADEDELLGLADRLALNPGWLIEGKGAPFCVDLGGHHRRVEELYEEIVAMEPERITFVRQREGGHGHHDAFIAVERDSVRWHIYRDTHPACDRVGGGGSHDLFELCRLIRRLDHDDFENRVPCFGRHFDAPLFEQLLEGEVYPGNTLDIYRNDDWWQAFSALRIDWVRGDETHDKALRNAIVIVKHQLARARASAKTHDHWYSKLAWGQFLPVKPKDADGDGEPWP